MPSTPSVRPVYGILQDVSLRTSLNQNPFIRAKVVAKRKDGTVAFSQEIITYKADAIAKLQSLGNGASVWMLGRVKSIPQQQGKFSIQMLDVFDVRDSSSRVNQDV